MLLVVVSVGEDKTDGHLVCNGGVGVSLVKVEEETTMILFSQIISFVTTPEFHIIYRIPTMN